MFIEWIFTALIARNKRDIWNWSNCYGIWTCIKQIVVVWIEGIRVMSRLIFLKKLVHAQKAQNINKRLSYAQKSTKSTFTRTKKHKTQISDFQRHQKFFCAQKNAALSVLFSYLHFVCLFLILSEILLLSRFLLVSGFLHVKFFVKKVIIIIINFKLP